MEESSLVSGQEQKKIAAAVKVFAEQLLLVNQLPDGKTLLTAALDKLNPILGKNNSHEQDMAGELLNKALQPRFEPKPALTTARLKQLRSKFQDAVKKRAFSKAALIETQFADAVSTIKITNEERLEILKKQYLSAMEEGDDQKTYAYASAFVQLAPDKRKAELSRVTSTVGFLEHKIALLERKAAVFDAMYDSEKTPQDVDDEKACLEKLLKTLGLLKEMTLAHVPVLDYPKEELNKAPKKTRLGSAGIPLRPMGRSPRPRELLASPSSQKVSRTQAFFQAGRTVEHKIDFYTKKLQIFLSNAEKNVTSDDSKDFECLLEQANGSFQKVYEAFSSKTLLGCLFKSSGESFMPDDFISGLREIGEILGRAVTDPAQKNAQLLKGLIAFFKKMPRQALEEFAAKVGCARYKNFYRAADYYLGTDVTGQKLNIMALGLARDSDGTKELGPVAELQTYNSYFVEALHCALQLHQIPYENKFARNDIVSHEQVLKPNQDFIRRYAMSGAGNYEIARYEH
ncbi:MAG: hypothetical protein SFW07_05080 [Gammaproteobacteria bacterium]|nr:hypothetical protein [Gammaproteobacteria bacterium]